MLVTATWCRVRIAVSICLVLVPATGFAQDRFFNSAGVQIRYVDHGTGEPVVLIHGFMASLEGWSRTEVLQHLAKDFRVIAMDCRGHGESGKPHDPDAYGAEMAEDVIRLLDHLNLDRAHVVGYSMGARLTGYLLANRPERLITATLGGSPPRQRWNAEEEARAERFIANVQEAGRSADPSDDQDYVALAAIPRSWHRQVVRESQLAATTVPTLAIVGSEDPRLSGMNALKVLVPALELVVIDGATHAGEQGALGHPEFVRAVHEFISSHRQR